MKKSILALGCVMIGVLAACSTESASKQADPVLVAAAEAAVITPSEAPSHPPECESTLSSCRSWTRRKRSVFPPVSGN